MCMSEEQNTGITVNEVSIDWCQLGTHLAGLRPLDAANLLGELANELAREGMTAEVGDDIAQVFNYHEGDPETDATVKNVRVLLWRLLERLYTPGA